MRPRQAIFDAEAPDDSADRAMRHNGVRPSHLLAPPRAIYVDSAHPTVLERPRVEESLRTLGR
jgi:hypothetical protein